MTDLPIGKPFSRIYGVPASLLADSKKLRRRLGAYVMRYDYNRRERAAGYAQREYGLSIEDGSLWAHFFDHAAISDVLDSITALHGYLNAAGYPGEAAQWLEFVARAFDEEFLGYRLDAGCAVRFRVDQQFEQSRTATLNGLGKPRYTAARELFEQGMTALDGAKPNTLLAVRGVFEANENVFKLMFPDKVKRLGQEEIDRNLRSLVKSFYGKPESDAANLMLSSFADWVNGMHIYRHAPGTEEPSPPPLELAVAIIDSGAAFLRWLIVIDAKTSKTKP